ncbi:hypothetical protein VCRA2113O325_110123 [Vibrio crassostreae]|nr:hypothetical protein VCRA2113O322_110040 [Vibrio crassostreae]CAK1715763.1 hypothetical protein VCRA2113O326_110052 [Vibrio crassostreae]CAK2535250.1 hypothetical protein VCRA2113O321_110052 [Vibrio crassostreae]CAK2539554.1 hypothetical protein VCRA2113O323_110123 [Vibrio crassostreae]CAK2593371.1 hypothetical protein VCRA2113O325_110123 [Vibrio crassostreae]
MDSEIYSYFTDKNKLESLKKYILKEWFDSNREYKLEVDILVDQFIFEFENNIH